MKYYDIWHCANTKEIGTFKQIEELTIQLRKPLIIEFHALDLSRDAFLKKLPPLNKFKLSKKAQTTDVLSSVFISINVEIIC